MIKKLLLVIGTLSYTMFLHAQGINKSPNKQVIISGFIDNSFLKSQKEEVRVNFYNEFNENLIANSDLLITPIVKSRFSVQAQCNSEVAYFNIENWPTMSLYQNIFLVQSGDSLCLNMVSEKEIYFSGKGSAKLNYQLWFAKFRNTFFKSFSKNDTSVISFNRLKAAKMISTALDSLDKIKETMNEDTYNLLRTNTVSAIKWECLSAMTAFIDSNDPAYINALQKEVFKLYQDQRGLTIINTLILDHSFLYVRYLYELSRINTTLSTKNLRSDLTSIYNSIKRDFTGLTRDKLLVQCFLNQSISEKDITKLLEDALSIIKDPSGQKILESRFLARKSGASAFKFDLEGINGEKIQLDQFIGKIVVIDSWFLGCPGCIGLARELESIIAHFKKRKDVVFLGVNVDKEHDKFIAGVKSGKYTSSQTINAYTNGLGYLHPMLKYYQYKSYPNLLLIDKNGKIIYADPPRPLTGPNKDFFIRLIEENL